MAKKPTSGKTVSATRKARLKVEGARHRLAEDADEDSMLVERARQIIPSRHGDRLFDWRIRKLRDKGDQDGTWWSALPAAYEALRAETAWLEDSLNIEGELSADHIDGVAAVFAGMASGRQADIDVALRGNQLIQEAADSDNEGGA